MSWIQQIILWAALPLSISLIITAINALQAVTKAKGEDNDYAANNGHSQQLM